MSADGLRRGESEAIFALARGATSDAAGEAAGVSGRTVRRWLEDPAFRRKVAELRAQFLDRTVGALAGAAVDAVETLRAALTAESENARIRAAVAILDAVIVVRESVDLERRVLELEAQDDDEGAL